MKNEIKIRVQELRKARNITQVQLAKILCVSKQSVSNWENNNILPSIEMLVRIAKYFRSVQIICFVWTIESM